MESHPSRREVLRKFIRAYRRYAELWDTKHEDYSNRSKKASSYSKLVDILKVIDPNATRETVVKQINSLRSNFRKELRKIKTRRKARGSTGEENIYTSTLWYYNDFLFLADCNQKQKIPLEMEQLPVRKEEENSSCSTDARSSPFLGYEYVDAQSDHSTAERQEMFPSAELHQQQPPEQQQRPTFTFNNLSDASIKLPSYMSKCIEKEDDEFSLLAKNYAMKLKKMDPLQLLFADRIINEVLLEGQLGTLKRYSSISTVATDHTSRLE